MISNNEIIEIAKESLKKFNLSVEVKFLPYPSFLTIAKKSPIILQSLKEGNNFDELNIPALIYHEKKDHIYLSKEILEKLLEEEPISIQRRFIKSVIYHEIFHILYKKKIKVFNFDNALSHESQISDQFKKEYPALESLGRGISKKYINF